MAIKKTYDVTTISLGVPDAIPSTFIKQRYEDCKGCTLRWNIFSTDMEAAFAKHEEKCIAKHEARRAERAAKQTQ